MAGWSSLRSDLSFGRIRLIFSGVVGLMVSYLPCKLQDDRPTFFSCQILQFLSEFFGHFIPVRWDNGRQVKKGACSAVFQPNWIQLSTCRIAFSRMPLRMGTSHEVRPLCGLETDCYDWAIPWGGPLFPIYRGGWSLRNLEF